MICDEDPLRRRPRESTARRKRQERCVWMARKMTEWPSKRGPITKIMPSDGCIGDTVPLAVGKWYEFHEFGWHMGNVGYNSIDVLRAETCACQALGCCRLCEFEGMRRIATVALGPAMGLAKPFEGNARVSCLDAGVGIDRLEASKFGAPRREELPRRVDNIGLSQHVWRNSGRQSVEPRY